MTETLKKKKKSNTEIRATDPDTGQMAIETGQMQSRVPIFQVFGSHEKAKLNHDAVLHSI
jgi:hypothetical protein